MERIHTGETAEKIEKFLGKFYALQGTKKKPEITLLVAYKDGKRWDIVPIWNTKDKNKIAIGKSLVQKMHESQAITSKAFDREFGKKIAAVNAKEMIVIMIGISNNPAKAIITKALHAGQVLDDTEYDNIKNELIPPAKTARKFQEKKIPKESFLKRVFDALEK